MVDETWTTVALPLLEEVLRCERTDPASATDRVFARTEGDPLAHRQLAALIEEGYLAGAGVSWALGRPEPIIQFDVIRLTPKGRRAVGDWPFGTAGDVLIRQLELMIASMPEGETASRLRRFLQAGREVGADVLTGVVTNVVKATVGLPPG